jgi:mono/diheme cytochrome c family protein
MITRKTVIGVGALVGLALGSALAFVLWSTAQWERRWDVPLPRFQRAGGGPWVDRGGRIFRVNCARCHLDEAGVARGKPLDVYPRFVGRIHSANITNDPDGGVGKWNDQHLERLIRTSVGRDGRLRPMPPFPAISDDDVGAIIGYMRSVNPIFAGDPERAPRSNVRWRGKLWLEWRAGLRPEITDAPVHVPMPEKAPTVEFGRYSAVLYRCVECHTEGARFDKTDQPDQLAGGLEHRLPDGRKLYSPNLTPSGTGLGGRGWTAADFVRALREGVTPDGRVLRWPMPRFREIETVELEAILRYLQSLKPIARGQRVGTLPVALATGTHDPAQMWTQLGCEPCHGPGAPFREQIVPSLAMTVEEVAARIRNPESYHLNAQMPTYATILDEPDAVTLAVWMQKNR